MSFWTIAFVVCFLISLTFRTTWKILGMTAAVGFWCLKWLIVIGALFGLLNSPQAYDAMGWTPLSLIGGDKLYQEMKANKE